MARSNNCAGDAWLALLDKVSVACAFLHKVRLHGEDSCFMGKKKVNFTIPALTACFILYTRCAGVVYFTTGAVFCSLSVKVVKRIIRQPRPTNLPGRKSKVSYGCVGRTFTDQEFITDTSLPPTACRVLTLLRLATTRRTSS